MKKTFIQFTYYLLLLMLISTGCVYYNTLFNAQQSYNQALELKDKSTTGRVSSDEVRLYKKTREKCAKIINKHPQSKHWDHAMLLTANSYFQQEMYDKAITIYTNLIESSITGKAQIDTNLIDIKIDIDTIEESYYMKGLAYYNLKDYDLALNIFQEMINKYPSGKHSIEAGLVIAETYYQQDDKT